MLNSYSLSILICFVSNLTRTCTKIFSFNIDNLFFKKKKLFIYICIGSLALGLSLVSTSGFSSKLAA